MNNLYVIKERLIEAMKLRGMNATELASKSGLAKSSVSRYLSGENIPRSIAIGENTNVIQKVIQKKNPRPKSGEFLYRG